MRCPACDADNPDLARFCASCGGRMTASCSQCGAKVALGARFCTSCGAAMPGREGRERTSGPHGAPHAPERRRVSVLFADLENFTGLAESLDPEEVRAVQSRYFEAARGTVSVYGGLIEKFIGDAVVAVWGAAVAHEDDAERAVRAALDLVAAVGQLAGSTARRPACRTGGGGDRRGGGRGHRGAGSRQR